MSLRFFSCFQPALLALPPEAAHRITLQALKTIPLPPTGSDIPSLQVKALGLSFPNPLGMAAGFDKNAEVPDPLLRLGFGFAEVGGVTPLPQSGNPRPRVFRLKEQGALINRLGFNNEGMAAVKARLSARKRQGIVGINLGANKNSVDKSADFVALIHAFAGLVDFATINISSPNTPGLRNLQEESALDDLLHRALAARDEALVKTAKPLPLLLKIAPDINLEALDSICALCLKHKIDGMVVSNTTVQRSGVAGAAHAQETGGLSGKPLFDLSTQRLAQTRLRVGKEMTLIGVGGIDSGEAAWAKITAGANLIQVYTGLIYKGLPLIDEIKTVLIRKLAVNNFTSLQQVVGSDVETFAHEN